jgi:class 3 adenylate cyclase
MSESNPSPPAPPGEKLETAVLFVDLVSSSDFASVLGLEEYAHYIDSFEELCRAQCDYFFRVVHANREWVDGVHYEVRFLGDELVVFMHTGRPHSDVYQLVALAISLKCGWLGTALNRQRVESGAPSAELAAGIHVGHVWAHRTKDDEYKRRGFTINVAKRVESASREGQHFRIYVSDPAMKRVNRQSRTLLFSPRKIVQMKGVVVPVGVYELVDSFINPMKRVAPALLDGFLNVARMAMSTNAYDLWIHSCLQVYEEEKNGKKVTEENLDLCNKTLNIDPRNACALLHAAQGTRDNKDWETARLIYEDLTTYWPTFGEGWLELGRLLKKMGDAAGARRAILQARRCAVAPEEEELPPATGIKGAAPRKPTKGIAGANSAPRVIRRGKR